MQVYPHASLDTSKSVIRSRELSLATPEEIEMALQKQGVKEYKKITIRRNNEIIHTQTYVQTFVKLEIPKDHPVGWICRIRRLHLWRGVRTPPAQWSPPVARGRWPVRRLDGIPVVEQSLIRRQVGQWLATYYFDPYLVWSHALAPVCLFSTEYTIQSAFAEQFPTYLSYRC